MKRPARTLIEQLELAQQCVDLGARTSTVLLLSGLRRKQLETLLPTWNRPRGRVPHGPDWFFSKRLINRVEASVFASLFDSFVADGVEPSQALLSGYRAYLAACANQKRGLNIDRAFHIAASLRGIWLDASPVMVLRTCERCGLDGLDQVGPRSASCPFCSLLERYPSDSQLQRQFESAAPLKPAPAPVASLSLIGADVGL